MRVAKTKTTLVVDPATGVLGNLTLGAPPGIVGDRMANLKVELALRDPAAVVA